MPASLSIGPAPSARLEVSRSRAALTVREGSSVVVGRGRSRVELRAQPAPSLRLSTDRTRARIEAAPGLRVVTGRQGIAGPTGPVGTGVEHLEPRIELLENTAVLTGDIDW